MMLPIYNQKKYIDTKGNEENKQNIENKSR